MTALCKTGIYDSGTKLIDDFTMIYSGLPKVNKTRSAHSGAICLNKTTTDIWKSSGSEWDPVSEKLLKTECYVHQ